MLSAVNSQKELARADVAMSFLSLICTAAILCWGLSYGRYGLDLTDEGYYLNWISNPFNFRASVTQFGFIYHPLYLLFGGDIASIRRVNLLITFGLAWAVTNLWVQSLFGKEKICCLQRHVCATAIATGSLVWIGLQTLTPSYNTLAFQALLVASLGLLNCEKATTIRSLAGWFLLGVGGWLAFMAKPTTAVALGVASICYLWLVRKITIRLLIVSIATVLVAFAVSANAIDGSILAFVDRIADGLELAKTLGVMKSPFHYIRLDLVRPKAEGAFPVFGAALVIYTILYLNVAKNVMLLSVGRLLVALVAITTCGIVSEAYLVPQFMGPYRRLLFLFMPLASFLFTWSVCGLKSFSQITRTRAVMGAFFALSPYIYAFGTLNNYWYSGAEAGFFWAIASLVFFVPLGSERYLKALLLCFGFLIQLNAASLIQSGFNMPYRQTLPLRENQYRLEIGGEDSTLIISQRGGQLLTEARIVAQRARFKLGAPMIDLSGQSPGVLYALGAKSVGNAWMIGGYPGSDRFAIAALKYAPCEELVIAWLLADPAGSTAISPSVLNSFGANIDTDYEVVGWVKTGENSGLSTKMQVQQILRPIRNTDIAMDACAATKKKIP